MFCSECGKPAHGKFCSHCGSALVTGAAVVGETIDLDHEVRYESILKLPQVREKIERSARQAKKHWTGEQFLSLAEKLSPVPIPFEGIAGVLQPLYASWGIKTGKERVQQVNAPVGQVIVRALCSLARHGQALQGVTQADDGCLIEATLPSDLFALAGKLIVGVHRSGEQTKVNGATNIGGQVYDWGKSNRCLNQLFDDLSRDAA
jgi:hypothetical protein